MSCRVVSSGGVNNVEFFATISAMFHGGSVASPRITASGQLDASNVGFSQSLTTVSVASHESSVISVHCRRIRASSWPPAVILGDRKSVV